MVDRPSALVLVDKDEGVAEHVAAVDPAGLSNGLDQSGLARSQGPAQRDDAPVGQHFPDRSHRFEVPGRQMVAALEGVVDDAEIAEPGTAADDAVSKRPQAQFDERRGGVGRNGEPREAQIPAHVAQEGFPGRGVGEVAQRAAQRRAIGRVLREGGLAAQRLGFVLGDDGAVVEAAGALREVITVFAEALHQVGLGPAGDVADGFDTQCGQAGCRLRADAP